MQLDNTTLGLLAQLHRGGDWAYYWMVSADGRAKTTIWYRTDQSPPPLPQSNGAGPQHAYFGVHPAQRIPEERVDAKTGAIYTPRPEQVRPHIEEIAAINCLYGDYDAKDFDGDKGAAFDRLDQVPLPASVVIDTGGGYHAYWLLDQPFLLDTPERRERAKRLQERWVSFIGADPTVHDLPRVLRLPHTQNWKYTPAPMVDVVRADVDQHYTLDALEAALPVDAPLPASKAFTRTPHALSSDHLRRWVDRRLEIAATGVLTAPGGGASDTRVAMGRLAGGVVHTGVYTEDEIVSQLMPFALQRSSDSERETERNLRNGIAYGKLSPLAPPPFPTDQPLILSDGRARCPACDTRVLRSKYDYDGTTEKAWYCPTCKGVMRWPADAYTPTKKPASATQEGTETVEDVPNGADPEAKRLTQSERILKQLQTWGYSFKVNLAGSILECNGTAMEDYLAAEIRMQYRDAGLKNIGALEDVYHAQARRNSYHPVREYLNGLVWDGKPHIDMLTAKFISSDPDIVYPDGITRTTPSVYLLRWLIGVVAKALDGNQNMMLVLGGRQRIGKSRFARWLCSGLPDYFIEEPINPGDKDNDVRLITKWIWEVSELDATTRKADVAALKGFITKGDVTVRKAYGRLDTHAPALASFIGTVNPGTGFLSDTENRRFWITTISHIDWSYLSIDIDQVWAEAVANYRMGTPYELLPCEMEHRDEMNKQHQVESILEGWIEKHFWLTNEPADRMTAADIIDHLRSKDIRISGSERALAMELARVLEHLKVARVRTASYRGYAGIQPRDTV